MIDSDSDRGDVFDETPDPYCMDSSDSDYVPNSTKRKRNILDYFNVRSLSSNNSPARKKTKSQLKTSEISISQPGTSETSTTHCSESSSFQTDNEIASTSTLR